MTVEGPGRVEGGKGARHRGNGYVMGEHAGDRSWQLALRLIAAWRETDGTRRQGAFAHRLAEAAAEDGTAAVERAVLGLTALGNMFIELYADSAGRSVDAVLQDAAALSWDDGPHGWPGETNRPPEPHERGM